MELSEYAEPLAYDAAFWMQRMQDPETGIAELGELSLDLAVKLRALAIIALVTKADSNTFLHNLMRSAALRVTYLSRVHADSAFIDHHYASGRYEFVLDAIASQDDRLARRIVELSPQEWRQGHEYEDDYCYAQILHALVITPEDVPNCTRWLGRLEAVLEGEPSPRLDTMRAIVGRDQGAFDVAFEALLQERTGVIAEDIERGQMDEPDTIALRQVFIEGVAVLRFAVGRGLRTQPEYRYCPSLTRVPMTKPFPGR